MNTGFFIDRPIFSAVISILIVLVGGIALMLLPIDQYPNVTPPVVTISASYPGASAITVTQAVATPIEQQLNGTPGMIYMESSSSNTGSLNVSVTFEVGTDPDMATIEIQNRIKLAESRLPAEVVENGISVERRSTSQLLTISLSSKDEAFDEIYLSNFATINVLDILGRIPGVGRVSNIGSRYYAMRIWVLPALLANYGLTVDDLKSAIKDQNRESAAGEFGLQPTGDVDITLPITTQGRLENVAQFENIIIRANADGSVIRLKDVARVSLESSSYNNESGMNGSNSAILAVYTLPGSNSVDVSNQVRKEMKRISKNFPEGLSYAIPFDITDYISQSINEVYKTLFEAILLVVLVVFLSLQSWRATLVPTIAVPISLIGTFAFMLAFGFSINLLTLLGLVLAIGIVVDDAIVVVENVERIMEEDNIGAREATHKAMKELSGALIATSLVLAAVFIPVSFLSGITGLLFRQFSITIAVSVLISTVVALTLSPAICALILKPRTGKKNIVFRRIDSWLDSGNNIFIKYVRKAVGNPRRVIIIFVMILGFTAILSRYVPSSFIPEEDQGFFKVEIALSNGATLSRTREVTNRAIDYFKSQPAVDYVLNNTGSSPSVGTNQSRADLTVILKPWQKRKDKSSQLGAIIEAARSEFYYYPEATFNITRPPVIPGLGTAGGFELQLQAQSGANWDQLIAATDTLILLANRSKKLTGVSSALQTDIPQLHFDLNRDRAKFLGIPLSNIFSTMKAFLGSVYVNDFNMFNRIYKVYIMAETDYRKHPDNIGLFYVKASNGAMVPLKALGKTEYTTGPGTIKRFNMFNASIITGRAAQGYSSGDAMAEMEKIAAKNLPKDIALSWSGLSLQEKQAEGQTNSIMFLVLLFVFLFLAAQYESWIVPIAVLLTLPLAAFGAFLGITITGLENDIYFQIGLVTLMGLAAKNAILIVEFAKTMIDGGMAVEAAAIKAARMRFRPLLMTSLAFVLGMLPLLLSTGPGSASRHSIGTGVFFGMLFSISVGIVYVPFFLVLVYKIKDKLLKLKK